MDADLTTAYTAALEIYEKYWGEATSPSPTDASLDGSELAVVVRFVHKKLGLSGASKLTNKALRLAFLGGLATSWPMLLSTTQPAPSASVVPVAPVAPTPVAQALAAVALSSPPPLEALASSSNLTFTEAELKAMEIQVADYQARIAAIRAFNSNQAI